MLRKHFAAIGATLAHGPWLEYYDQEGKGYAQPDALAEGQGWIVVVEVKRTFVPDALAKLEHFYKPLVAALYPGRAIYCVQVCKHLTPQAKTFRTWIEPWELPKRACALAAFHMPLLYG